MEGITPEAWLNLGIPGAALFIVLVIVISMFKQQSKSVDKLCVKIDELVTSFSDNNLKLNEVIISNDRDQKEVLRKLDDMCDVMNDMHKRVVRIDVRLYDKSKVKEEE
jgi:predicted glycosyltransferase